LWEKSEVTKQLPRTAGTAVKVNKLPCHTGSFINKLQLLKRYIVLVLLWQVRSYFKNNIYADILLTKSLPSETALVTYCVSCKAIYNLQNIHTVVVICTIFTTSPYFEQFFNIQ
jgi:hypothetical protein